LVGQFVVLVHVLQAPQIVLPTIIPNKLLLHVLQAPQIVLPTILPNKGQFVVLVIHVATVY
jgi:hypothetical protein